MTVAWPYSRNCPVEVLQRSYRATREAAHAAGHAFHTHACDEIGYIEVWRCLWETPGSLIVVEHDMVPTPDQVAAIASCRERLCVGAYLQRRHANSGMTHRTWTVRPQPGQKPIEGTDGCFVGFGKEAVQIRVLEEGDAWADLYGFGLVKLSEPLRRELTPAWLDSAQKWSSLDTRLSLVTSELGIRAHVHWPLVEHLAWSG